MKAISIRQPWAWLIIRPDIVDILERAKALGVEIKDIENRDWWTSFRGKCLIHASKGTTEAEWNDGWWALEAAAGEAAARKLPRLADLPRGGIVGVTDIFDCVRDSSSPWFQGEYGFRLRESRPLPFVPFRGQLGFFEVPGSILQAVA